jgi:hypothetical protein
VTDDEKPDIGEETGPELCDLCGAVVADSTELYALVPDSSAVHAVDPKFDGKRMVVGCSREHLTELVEQYKRRPFVDEELWAGKIVRAMRKYPERRISEQDLARETGLAPDQVERAVDWQNAQVREWREKYGRDDHGWS